MVYFVGVTAEYPATRSYTPKNSGYAATWLRSYMATRLHGYAATQLHGYAATWLRGYVATRLHGYAATWLRGYAATRLHPLKNELDSCAAFSFRLMDYCFGTLIKERVKFLFSARLNS